MNKFFFFFFFWLNSIRGEKKLPPPRRIFLFMKERNSSFDILRIIATFQVIILHLYVSLWSVNRFNKSFLTLLIFVMSESCNIHFLFLSSYFSCRSKYSLWKILPVILQTIFYSTFGFFTSVLFFKKKAFNTAMISQSLIPMGHSRYWFNYPFLLSQFVCSFIYPTLLQLEKKRLLLITVIFVLVYTLPSVGIYECGFKPKSIIGFMAYSFIGTYIRLYPSNYSLLIHILIYIVTVGYNYFINYNYYLHSEFRIIQLFLIRSIFYMPQIIMAVASFSVFAKLKITTKYASIIQHFAEFSLGIYMLHYTREHRFIWINAMQQYADKKYIHEYWQYALYNGLKIYIVGCIIEFTRYKLFQLLIFRRQFYLYPSRYIQPLKLIWPFKKCFK